MTDRRSRALVVAAVLATLIVPMGAGAKRNRSKNVFTATVNGKRIKFPFHPSFTAGGTTVAFFGSSQTRPRLGRLLRTIAVGCADFPPTAVPGTSVACTASYQEAKLGRHPSTKFWTDSAADLSVTFESYDGSHVEGSFSATLPSITGEPPVTVEGHFSGHVVVGS